MKKFLILCLSILFTSPLFASGIGANATSAPCDNATLETYGGTANVEINWEPNTINLRWYDGDTRLNVQNAAQTCTYDDTLTVPSQPTRTGYTFIGWELKYAIPAEYTELQYIESTGTQWIDTGVTPTNNTGLTIDLQYTNSSSSEQIAIGALNPNFLIDRVGNRFYFAYKTGEGLNFGFLLSSDELIARHTLELNWKNDKQFKFGDNIYNLSSVDFSNPNPVYIFSCGGYTLKNMRGRVYNVKISNYKEIVRNFVPAKRNSDNELGMYDTVTKTFFTNAGTGTFIAGPVVQ